MPSIEITDGPNRDELVDAFVHAYDPENPKTVTFSGIYTEYGLQPRSCELSFDFQVEGLAHANAQGRSSKAPRDGHSLRIRGRVLNIPELLHPIEFPYHARDKDGYLRLVHRTADIFLHSVMSPITL